MSQENATQYFDHGRWETFVGHVYSCGPQLNFVRNMIRHWGMVSQAGRRSRYVNAPWGYRDLELGVGIEILYRRINGCPADIVFGIPEHRWQQDRTTTFLLEHKVRFDELPVRKQVSFVDNLGQAIRACHEAGFCHLDIKPSNLLVPFGIMSPLLSDLKIVREIGARNVIEGESSPPGSECYAPPEQYKTKTEIEVTMDIYALTVTLGEILTGNCVTTPFDFRHHGRLLSQIYGPNVVAVFERGWQYDPEDRYRTVSEFIEDLAMSLSNDA